MKRQPDSAVDGSVDTSGSESVNLSVSEIGARMKTARKAIGLTQEALANLAGAKSKSGLQDNEAGKTMPGGQMIGALVHAGINANWVLTGEGAMFVASQDRAVYQLPAAGQLEQTAPEAPRGVEFDPLLLQQVVDFMYRWLDDNQVVLEHSKYGKVIAVLYRVASARGRVEIHELEQVLRFAA